jgi:hypothetical protein
VIYTIRITNNTGGPVTISQIQDTFTAFTVTQCQSPRGGSCTLPIIQPGTVTWTGSVPLLNRNQTMDLEIQGVFNGAPVGAPACNPTVLSPGMGPPVTHAGQHV